jgi:6-phosphogluconolactonase
MDRLQLHTFVDAEAVSQAAAREFGRLAADAVRERGRFVVALSGGSTPRRLYQILAEPAHRDTVPWDKVHLFWGDERSVPPDNAESNYRMANEAMLSKVPIPPANVHRLPAERDDRDAAARDYAAEIAKVFGVPADGPPPAFDLVLLGMGPDAHTASLFPHTTGLAVTDRWVTPNYVPKFNTYRLTFTRPMINAARQVLFLVAGPDKKDPLFEIFTGPPDTSRLPSQLIRPTSGLLVWYVDKAAIARLTAGFEGGAA